MSGQKTVQPRFKPSNSRIHVYSATDIPTYSVRRNILELNSKADAGDHAVSGVGLRLLIRSECGFEPRRGQECLYLVSVVR
jgi:hypothetical protein